MLRAGRGYVVDLTKIPSTVNTEPGSALSGCFSVYGFEYKTGVPDGFITWISEGAASWTAKVTGLGPDNLTEIGQRIIPDEPLYCE